MPNISTWLSMSKGKKLHLKYKQYCRLIWRNFRLLCSNMILVYNQILKPDFNSIQTFQSGALRNTMTDPSFIGTPIFGYQQQRKRLKRLPVSSKLDSAAVTMQKFLNCWTASGMCKGQTARPRVMCYEHQNMNEVCMLYTFEQTKEHQWTDFNKYVHR